MPTRVEGYLARNRWPILLLGLLVPVCVLVSRAGFQDNSLRKGDTRFYRIGAQRFLDGADLYYTGPPLDNGWHPTSGYTYLPPFAAASVWMVPLPYGAVRLVWLGLMLACSLGCFWLASRWLDAWGQQRTPVLTMLLTALILFRFWNNDLAHGQVNWLVTLLLGWTLYAGQRGREASAGLALGLALVIKPTSWMLGLWYLLARGQWRLALACGGSFVGALLLPLLRYGPQDYLSNVSHWYLRMVDFAQEAIGSWVNVSLSSSLFRLMSGQADGEGLTPLLFQLDPASSIPWSRGLASAAVAATFLFLLLKRRRAAASPVAVLLLGALLSPVTWKAHLVLLVFPVALLCRRLLDGPSGRRRWLLAAGWAALLLFPSQDLFDGRRLEAYGTLTLAICLLCAWLAGQTDEEIRHEGGRGGEG